MDIAQIALGGLMCLLLAVRFVWEVLRMYRATKRFEPGRYMVLLAREGVFYFVAYVLPFLRCVARLMMNLYG